MKRLLCLCLLCLCAACGGVKDPPHILQSARQHRSAGEVRTAIIELKGLLQQQPSLGPARLLLGETYLDLGDVLPAEKELQKALDLGMPPLQVWPLLAQALLSRGEAQQLERRLDPAQIGNQPEMLVLRARALLALQQQDAARALLQQVLQGRKDYPPALLVLARMALQGRDKDTALRLVEQVLQQQPQEPEALQMQADLLRMAGRLKEATAIYQRLCQLAVWRIQPRVELASLQIQQQQYVQARAMLELARKLAPQNLLLNYTQAMLDVQEKHYVLARDRLQMVLRAAPEYPAANLLMATVQRHLGDQVQAERAVRSVLNVYPRHPVALRQLAAIQLAQQQSAAALDTLAPLLAAYQQPDSQPPANQPDAALLAMAGEAHLQLRHYAQAMTLFEQASTRAPQQPMLIAAQAVAQLGMGQDAAASLSLQRAAALDGTSLRVGVLQVLAYLRQQQYAQAQTILQPLLNRHPDNPMLHNLYGGVLQMQRQLPAARKQYELALNTAPGFLPALDNLTRMDLAAGQGEQARQRLEAAWSRDSSNAELALALATLAATQRQPTVQGRWLENALRLRPDDPAIILANAQFLMTQKQTERATSLLRQLLANQPDHLAALDMLASQLLQTSQFEAALAALERMLTLTPANPALLLRKAQACEGAALDPCASAALRQAVALQPDYPPAYTALVHYQLRKRQYGAAAATAAKLGTTSAHRALSYRLEGDIQMAQQHYPQAVAAYQRAQQTLPASAHVQALYAAQLRAGMSEPARQQIDSWLRSHPDDQVTRLYWADSLRQQKDYAASQHQLELLLERQPDSPVALNNLAWLYQQLKDKRALAVAERAYRLAPDSAPVLDTLGWVLYEKGEVARALPILRQAASAAPQDQSIRQHLAMAAATATGPTGGASR